MKVKSLFTLEGELGALSDKALLARAEDEGLFYHDLKVRAKWVARLRRRLGKPGFTETCRLPEDFDLGFWLRTVLVGAIAQALYGRHPKTFIPAGTKVHVLLEGTNKITRDYPVKADLVPAQWLTWVYLPLWAWDKTGANPTEWKVFKAMSRIGCVRKADLRVPSEV